MRPAPSEIRGRDDDRRLQRFAERQGYEVGATTDVTVGTVSGHEVQLMKDGRPAMIVREFVTNNPPLSNWATTSVLGVDDPAIKAFLNSFKFIGG